MQSYPIWCKINSCAYSHSGSGTGNKSYGIKDHSECEVVVGTSAKNSHYFVEYKTTHRLLDNGDRSFRFYVEGIIVREAILKKGASELLFKNSEPLKIYSPNDQHKI